MRHLGAMVEKWEGREVGRTRSASACKRRVRTVSPGRYAWCRGIGFTEDEKTALAKVVGADWSRATARARAEGERLSVS